RDLHAATVGRVTGDRRFRLFHKGNVVADVPVDALAEEAPEYHLPAKMPAIPDETESIPHVDHLDETLLALLSQPTIASKEWVYSQYDSTVRSNTITGPGSGAAVLAIPGTRKALAMTTDGNSRYL